MLLPFLSVYCGLQECQSNYQALRRFFTAVMCLQFTRNEAWHLTKKYGSVAAAAFASINVLASLDSW